MSAPDTLRDGNASTRIADGLREAILRGEYLPGDRIIQEDLSARYGGSRIPVREALRQLESDGLVRLVANTGAWVASLTMAECSEVYQTRERLEPLLLRFSAEHLTTETLATLDRLAHQMEDAPGVEEFLELDRRFHFATYDSSHTHTLGPLVTRLWNTTQPYRRAYTTLVGSRNRRIFHDEHHMLVTALYDGDLELAEQILALHIRRTRLHLERHPELFDPTTPPQ
ncbi:MAG: GntR family transcriptional regulator [Microbacteriaceae bacterium]|jgi:DNA-binding GntR family transcriptional regulator|nr:GntR family transcriptional regulator [Microbacteriaceae bacterium]MBT5248212.1 GntR family transcriptional regulator [Microbacteriaceae bacterium]MBT5730434.1 GntR family transcriptional regulator [Microbacteriaceae bacterium]